MYKFQLGKALAFLTIPALSLLTACDSLKGEGDVLTEVRNATDFSGVDASVSGEVHITQGDTFSVTVKAEENLLPYLKTQVESDGALHVYFSRPVRDVDHLEVEITMPELKNIQLSGSGQVHTHGNFSGGTLNLGVSGSGEVDLDDFDYKYVAANVSGSGKIQVAGAGAEELDANLSGSGTIEAVQFPVKTAEVYVSGSGTIRLEASEKLIAHVSGSGHVRYEGNPVVEKHISGSGSVTKL